jgi:polyisoprenoid-binding protein YceI
VLESKSTVENEFNIKAKAVVEIKGITKEMEINFKATYLKDKLGDRVQKQKGDLLVLRATFTVTREDFKIKAGEMLSVIANDIVISANVTGACIK